MSDANLRPLRKSHVDSHPRLPFSVPAPGERPYGIWIRKDSLATFEEVSIAEFGTRFEL